MNRFQYISLILLCGLILSSMSCRIRSTEEVDYSEETLAPDMSPEDSEGYTEELGVMVLRGNLSTTKGAQPMLDGVILAFEIFSTDMQEVHSIIESYKGKRMEVKGKVNRYHCGPMEQCMSPGYIDRMEAAEYIKVL